AKAALSANTRLAVGLRPHLVPCGRRSCAATMTGMVDASATATSLQPEHEPDYAAARALKSEISTKAILAPSKQLQLRRVSRAVREPPVCCLWPPRQPPVFLQRVCEPSSHRW